VATAASPAPRRRPTRASSPVPTAATVPCRRRRDTQRDRQHPRTAAPRRGPERTHALRVSHAPIDRERPPTVGVVTAELDLDLGPPSTSSSRSRRPSRRPSARGTDVHAGRSRVHADRDHRPVRQPLHRLQGDAGRLEVRYEALIEGRSRSAPRATSRPSPTCARAATASPTRCSRRRGVSSAACRGSTSSPP
jgi:hypothetical protein